MNTYIKTIATVILCSLCISAIAGNRFIVKYKLDKSQISFLLNHSGVDKEEAEEQIRKKLMEKLSDERLDALSKVADNIDKVDADVLPMAAGSTSEANTAALPTADKIKAKYLYPVATGAHVVALSKDLDEEQTKRYICNVEQIDDIEYICEDQIVEVETSSVSVNPAYQWDMVGIGGFSANITWNGDNFVEAWDTLSRYNYIPGKNVTVAVLDTGYTPHINFVNNLQTLNGTHRVYGYKFIADCRMSGECPANTSDTDAHNNTSSKYTPDGLDLGDFITTVDIRSPFFKHIQPSNSSWHGSHVIGSIVGNMYNNSNPDYMTGGAYGAVVVPVRVLGKGGGYTSDIVNGMMWAAGINVTNVDNSSLPVNPNPADVINMSLGSRGLCNRMYQDAINKVVARGAMVVVAAGNAKSDIANYTPAGCSNVISVAAKGPTGKLAYYSNFGATTITASGGDIKISGSSSAINSTIWSSLEAYQSYSSGGHGTWKWMQGTSMATPHVSAAIANLIGIFKANNETYTHQRIVDILQNSAIKYDACNKWGCATNYTLDASEAVNCALTSQSYLGQVLDYLSSWLPSKRDVGLVVLSVGMGAGAVLIYYNKVRPHHQHAD